MRLNRINLRYRILGSIGNSFAETITKKYKKTESYAYQGVSLIFLEFMKEKQQKHSDHSEVSFIYRLLLQEIYYRYHNHMVINRNEILAGIEQAIEQHLSFIRKKEPQRYDELQALYWKIRDVTQAGDLQKMEKQIKEKAEMRGNPAALSITSLLHEIQKKFYHQFEQRKEKNRTEERNETDRQILLSLIQTATREEQQVFYQYFDANNFICIEKEAKKYELEKLFHKTYHIEYTHKLTDKRKAESLIKKPVLKEILEETVRNMSEIQIEKLVEEWKTEISEEQDDRRENMIETMLKQSVEEKKRIKERLLDAVNSGEAETIDVLYDYLFERKLIYQRLTEKQDRKEKQNEVFCCLNELLKEEEGEEQLPEKTENLVRLKEELKEDNVNFKQKNFQKIKAEKWRKESEKQLLFWINREKRRTSYINREIVNGEIQREPLGNIEQKQGFNRYNEEIDIAETILERSVKERRMIKENLLTAVETGDSETIDILYSYLLERKLIYRQLVEKTEKEDKKERQNEVFNCLKEILKENENDGYSLEAEENLVKLKRDKVNFKQENSQNMEANKKKKELEEELLTFWIKNEKGRTSYINREIINREIQKEQIKNIGQTQKFNRHKAETNITEIILNQSVKERKKMKENLLTIIEAGETETIDMFYDYLFERKLIYQQLTEKQDRKEKQKKVFNCLKEILKENEGHRQLLSEKKGKGIRAEEDKGSPEKENFQKIREKTMEEELLLFWINNEKRRNSYINNRENQKEQSENTKQAQEVSRHTIGTDTSETILNLSVGEKRMIKKNLLTAVESEESEAIDVLYRYLFERKLIYRQLTKEDKKEKQTEVISCLKELLKEDESYEEQISEKKENLIKLESEKVTLEQENSQELRASKWKRTAEEELLLFWKNNMKKMTSYININGEIVNREIQKEQSENAERMQEFNRHTAKANIEETILNQSDLNHSIKERNRIKEHLLTVVESGEPEIINVLYQYLSERKLIYRQLTKEDKEEKQTEVISCLKELLKEDESYEEQISEKKENLIKLESEKVILEQENSQELRASKWKRTAEEELLLFWKNNMKKMTSYININGEIVNREIQKEQSENIEQIQGSSRHRAETSISKTMLNLLMLNDSIKKRIKENLLASAEKDESNIISDLYNNLFIGQKLVYRQLTENQDKGKKQKKKTAIYYYRDIRTNKNIAVKSAIWKDKKNDSILERYLKELKKTELDTAEIKEKQQEKQIELFLKILEESSSKEKERFYQYIKQNHLLYHEKKEISEQTEGKEKALTEWIQSASETAFYKLQEKFMEEYEKQQRALIEQVSSHTKYNNQNNKGFYKENLLYPIVTKYFETLQKLSIQGNDSLLSHKNSLLEQQKQILLMTISKGSKEEKQSLYTYLTENHFIYRNDAEDNPMEQLRQMDKKKWKKLFKQLFIRENNYFIKIGKNLSFRDIRMIGKEKTITKPVSYLLSYQEETLLFRKELAGQGEAESKRKEIRKIVQQDVTKTIKLTEENRKQREADTKKEYQKQQTELLLVKAELKKQQEKMAEIERYQLKMIKPDEVYQIVMKKMEKQLRLERLRRGFN